MVTYLKFNKDICKTEVKLYGKTVLITGANSGKMKMCPVLNSKVKIVLKSLNETDQLSNSFRNWP